MSFALLVIGITLIVSGVRNTSCLLVKLIQKDFTGPSNFFYWVAVVMILGAVGYIQKLKPLSDGLLVVIILVLLLRAGNPSNPAVGGFFAKLQAALKSTQSGSGATVSVNLTAPTVVSG